MHGSRQWTALTRAAVSPTGTLAIAPAAIACPCEGTDFRLGWRQASEINRAPVLTLWAAVIAERLGHPADTALTVGRAVAGSAAGVKARNIGREERKADRDADRLCLLFAAGAFRGALPRWIAWNYSMPRAGSCRWDEMTTTWTVTKTAATTGSRAATCLPPRTAARVLFRHKAQPWINHRKRHLARHIRLRWRPRAVR